MVFPLQVLQPLAWPFAILVAWGVGELAAQWARVPRITSYAGVGMLFAPSMLGVLPAQAPEGVPMLAAIAFGSILFEAGYRTNLRWLVANPWLLLTSLLEAGLTFMSVRWVLGLAAIPSETAALLAALAVATSPAATLRVINEQRASGQVTERAIHLAVLNCAMGIVAFALLQAWQAPTVRNTGVASTWDVLTGAGVAVLLGALFGILIPPLLRALTRQRDEGILAFALAVAVIVGLAEAFAASPALASLTFGLVARARRTVLSAHQRGFGTLGQLLSVLLFVYVASMLEWSLVMGSLGVGLAVIAARLVATCAATTACAIPSGISWQKGTWSGVALAPFSAFALILLDRTTPMATAAMAFVAPLAGAILLLELIGPLLVALALRAAHEVPDAEVVG